MPETLVQYEWEFLTPKSTFDFLLTLNGPVVAKSVIYLVEGLGSDGSSDNSISFDWLHSRALERWFLYAEDTEGGVKWLRPLHADAPVSGLRLTVKQWDNGAGPAALAGHTACWLWGAPQPGSHEISVLTPGRRTEVAA